MLEIRSLSKWFGGLPALQDVSFAIETGRITALIGPNGAGKSTLINCISGVDSAQKGRILLDDHPIHKLAPHRVAALGIARTFQNR